MGKPLLINLIFLAVAISLGAVVWFDPFAPTAPEPIPLTTKNPSEVDQIHLSRLGHVEFALQRRSQPVGGKKLWYLQQPVAMPASEIKVAQLLGLLTTNSLHQYQIKSDNLPKLGLQPPQWEIQLGDTVVKFGKTEPIDQKRFVLVNNTVHLINDQYSQYRFGSPLMLANLDILPVDKSVKELHLPDNIIKKVDGRWQSSSAGDTNTQNNYKELIDRWRYAQALRVAMADNVDKAGLFSDATNVTVYLENAQQPVHFSVRDNDQNVIVTNEDWGVTYYLAPKEGKKLLQLKPPTQQ